MASRCRELRIQFKNRHSDLDIKEMIRNRNQRATEKFHTYYDAILQLTDRVKVPIPDKELVEILKGNLRLDVRKELVHLKLQLHRPIERLRSKA